MLGIVIWAMQSARQVFSAPINQKNRTRYLAFSASQIIDIKLQEVTLQTEEGETHSIKNSHA